MSNWQDAPGNSSKYKYNCEFWNKNSVLFPVYKTVESECFIFCYQFSPLLCTPCYFLLKTIHLLKKTLSTSNGFQDSNPGMILWRVASPFKLKLQRLKKDLPFIFAYSTNTQSFTISAPDTSRIFFVNFNPLYLKYILLSGTPIGV